MMILVSLAVAALLLFHGSAADTDASWELLVSKYFAAKDIHSIDVLVCSSEDGLRLYRNLAKSSQNIALPSFLRVVDSFSIVNIDSDMRAGIFIDVSCVENRELLFGLADDRLFTNNFVWLVWDPQELLTESYAELPLSTFSDVSVGSIERVVRLYKHKSGMPLIARDIGLWTAETKEFSVMPWNVRIDYEKTVVNGAIMFIEDIYDRSMLQQQLQDDQYKPGNDVSNRFIYGNTLHLAYLYNFTLNLTETRNWGERSSNGTWSGLIGLLQRQEADLTISPLLPLSQRMEVSYPSIPTLPYWMAVIFKQPRALGTYRAMILELSPETWAFVALLIVSGAMVFAVTQRHDESDSTSHDSDGSFAMGFVQSVGIIANQGLSLMPEGNPARIVCLSLLVVGLLISNYYNAATMTALLSQSPPVIKSLEQLMSSKTSLSALDAPYVHLKTSRSRVFRNIVVDRMEKDLSVCSLTEGIETVMNGSAFLGEYFVLFRAITENLQSDVICDLTIFNAGFHQNAVSFTKKCPHFRELYTRGMLRTLEHGLMPKERQRWVAGQPVCSHKTEFIHVQLEAVSVAFGVFLIGCVLSVAGFVVESLLGRRKRRTGEVRADLNRRTMQDLGGSARQIPRFQN